MKFQIFPYRIFNFHRKKFKKKKNSRKKQTMCEASDEISNQWYIQYLEEIKNCAKICVDVVVEKENDCIDLCSKTVGDRLKCLHPAFDEGSIKNWLKTDGNLIAIPAAVNICYHLYSLFDIRSTLKAMMSQGEKKGSVYDKVSSSLNKIDSNIVKMQKLSDRITNPNIPDHERMSIADWLDDITRYQDEIRVYLDEVVEFLLDCIQQIDSTKRKSKIGLGVALLTLGYGVFNLARYGLSSMSVATGVAVASGVIFGAADIYYINKARNFRKQLVEIRGFLCSGKLSDRAKRTELALIIGQVKEKLTEV